MKKVFVFLALVLASLGMTACVVQNNAQTAVKDAMVECFKDVDLSKVEANLEFKTKLGEVTLSYMSSDENVISNEGIVNRQTENVTIEITVTFTKDDYSEKKVYSVTVLAKGKTTIQEVKQCNNGEAIVVEGIVAYVVYGTEKNVPVGFYIFDETDSIYVHSSSYAETVKVGNFVHIQGEFTKYIDANSTTSAEKAGYTGAKQIIPTTLTNDNQIHSVPTSFIQETSIADLCMIPVSENITSNVYKVVANIHKSVGNGFVNYYFNDLNGVNSYYAYTTANGKDLAWLEEYDGSVRECLIAVHNCKLSASGNFWRIVPIQILDEVNVDDKTYMEYALDRLATQFSKTYDNPCTFTLATTDQQLEGAKVSYTSVSNGVTLVQKEDIYEISLNFGVELTKMEVEITLQYNDLVATRTISFEGAISKPDIETISIEEARRVPVGQQVTIQGYVVGFLYLKGTTTPAGFEIMDETSSIAVFVSTAVDTTTDITKLKIGEYVYVTGFGDLYQPREDNNHTGSIRLNQAEVLYHDWQEHELPVEYIEEKDFASLVQNPSDNNISNMVFKTTMYVERTTGSYVNYYIHDLNDPSLSMIVYSQNSGKNGPGEYAWLEQYAGKCVEAYVTLRIGAVSSKKFVWKAGVLQVLGEVATPDHLLGYFEKSTIEHLFVSEYANEATITYNVPEGATLSLDNCSSKQVSASQVGQVFTLTIASPTQTEDVTLALDFAYGTYQTTIEVSFKIVKAESITVATFREQAQRNGSTVVVEGIVSAVVKSKGATSWGFFVTDETGTLYCKTQGTVEVGDKVILKGNMDLYYGLPQFAADTTITVVSKGNEVPNNSFIKDILFANLVAASLAGEDAKLGAVVYQDVVATVHVEGANQRAYLSVGSDEIELYNYTNANYYAENYQALEALNGKNICVTLIAYNWYKTQYTYVIANYTVVEE